MAKTGTPKKPGTELTRAGLILAALGALLMPFTRSSEGDIATFTIAFLVAGLILAGIGFARRVLAALENR